jgi:hypothetical protein
VEKPPGAQPFASVDGNRFSRKDRGKIMLREDQKNGTSSVALLLAAIIISSMNFLFYFFSSLPFVHDQAVQPAENN